jgi:hypothetical protein
MASNSSKNEEVDEPLTYDKNGYADMPMHYFDGFETTGMNIRLLTRLGDDPDREDLGGRVSENRLTKVLLAWDSLKSAWEEGLVEFSAKMQYDAERNDASFKLSDWKTFKTFGATHIEAFLEDGVGYRLSSALNDIMRSKPEADICRRTLSIIKDNNILCTFLRTGLGNLLEKASQDASERTDKKGKKTKFDTKEGERVIAANIRLAEEAHDMLSRAWYDNIDSQVAEEMVMLSKSPRLKDMSLDKKGAIGVFLTLRRQKEVNEISVEIEKILNSWKKELERMKANRKGVIRSNLESASSHCTAS